MTHDLSDIVDEMQSDPALTAEELEERAKWQYDNMTPQQQESWKELEAQDRARAEDALQRESSPPAEGPGTPLTPAAPGGPGPQKNQNFDGANPQVQQAYDNQSIELKQTGVGGTPSIEAVPTYKRAPIDFVLENSRNASIVLGVDRNGSVASGYGGRGGTQVGAIDIVAGRMGAYVQEHDVKTGEPIEVNPNFRIDAARIYISQKSDIDEYFGLSDGKVGNPPACSGIGIKADEVRVVARGGIKLVTGTDVRNARGYLTVATKGIDLIAGNQPFGQQPLVKGNNLVYAMVGSHIGANWKWGQPAGLVGEIEKLREIVYSFLKYQKSFNQAITSHTHISNWPGAPTPPPFTAMSDCVKSLVQLTAQTELSINTHATSLSAWAVNSFAKNADLYINSAHNTTN